LAKVAISLLGCAFGQVFYALNVLTLLVLVRAVL
jgi:hypothetical protein